MYMCSLSKIAVICDITQKVWTSQHTLFQKALPERYLSLVGSFHNSLMFHQCHFAIR